MNSKTKLHLLLVWRDKFISMFRIHNLVFSSNFCGAGGMPVRVPGLFCCLDLNQCQSNAVVSYNDVVRVCVSNSRDDAGNSRFHI